MPSFAKLSLAELEAEISRRKRDGKSLLRQRAKVAAKLAALDQQLSELGLRAGSNGHKTGKRPRNEMSLVDALGNVLKGKTMSISDAMTAVQKAGYRSSAKSFRSVVSIALTQSGHFKRVDRGQYTAK